MRIANLILQILLLIMSIVAAFAGDYEMGFLGLIMVELIHLENRIEDAKTINIYMDVEEFIDKISKLKEAK